MKKLIDTSKINDPIPKKKRSKAKVEDGHAKDKQDNYRADHPNFETNKGHHKSS